METLSDKLKTKAELFSNRAGSDEGEKSFLFKYDVIEFIKELKTYCEGIIIERDISTRFLEFIDKKAGEKLIDKLRGVEE